MRRATTPGPLALPADAPDSALVTPKPETDALDKIVALVERGAVSREDKLIRWLVTTMTCIVIAFGFGENWDRHWHVTNPVESFFIPPHILIYGFDLLGALSAIITLRYKDVLRGTRVRGIPVSLGVLLLGYSIEVLSGLFDGIWHSAFGLDETVMSFPHQMIGSGAAVITLGAVATRLATSRATSSQELTFYSVFLGSFPLLEAASSIFKQTPEWLVAFSEVPTLHLSPGFQHVIYILLQWHVYRVDSPVFVLLTAAAAGVSLGLIFRMTSKVSALVVATIITVAPALGDLRVAWMVMHLERQITSWLPIPVLIPALIYAVSERLALVAGLALAAACALIWYAPLGSVLLAAPVFWLGTRGGEFVYQGLVNQDRRLLHAGLAAGIGWPLITGSADLVLRFNTP